MLNYPVAIACINVVAVLVKFLGLGDGGMRSDEVSIDAPQTFAALVASAMDNNACPPAANLSLDGVSCEGLDIASTIDAYQKEFLVCDSSVFEDMF